MNAIWYYLHNNAVCGPFTTDEIKDHAVRDLLAPHDLLWPHGEDQRTGIRAMCAINFGQMQKNRASNVPDWLEDVAATQEYGPLSARWTPLKLPEWLDDVVRLEGAAAGEEAPVAEPVRQCSRSEQVTELLLPPAATVFELPETPHARQASTPSKPALPDPPPKKTQLPPPAPVTRIAPSSAPLAVPVKAVPPPPPAILLPDSSPPPQFPDAASTPPPFAPPQPPPRPPAAPTLLRPLAARMAPSSSLESTGLTPAAPLSSATHVETIFEVLWKAKGAISRWADLDELREPIMKNDLAVLRRNASLLEALAPYEKYGKAVAEKLWQAVDSTVANRRRYYLALDTSRT